MKLFIPVLALSAVCLRGQIAIPNGAPPSFQFDGRVDEWAGLTPARDLGGPVWVRQVPEGLLIAGRVDRAKMGGKGDVEVWLAAPADPEFPPLLDDNGKAFVTSDDCGNDQKCREWVQSMGVYRGLLARTFVRRYRLSAAAVEETYARPAYQQMLQRIEKNFHSYLEVLAPAGTPQFRWSRGAGGYSFEALIPCEALPPFASLELKELRLAVEVPGSAGEGLPAWATAVLEAGRHFHVTACNFALEGRDTGGEHGPAYFLPRRDDDITRVFRLINFDPNFPHYPSPVSILTAFAEKPVRGKVVVCGPPLSVARNGAVERFELDFDPAKTTARAEADGSILVLSGPYLRKATQDDENGCCEHMSVYQFHAWLVSPTGSIQEILEQHLIVSGMYIGPVDMRVAVSPDTRRITVSTVMVSMDHKETTTSATFCREGAAYKPCDEKMTPRPARK